MSTAFRREATPPSQSAVCSGMASGRDNKLTGAAGEFLVAAELCRRGHLATPFAGNVPEFDVVAVGESGRQALVPSRDAKGASSSTLASATSLQVTCPAASGGQSSGRCGPPPAREGGRSTHRRWIAVFCPFVVSPAHRLFGLKEDGRSPAHSDTS